MSSTEYATEYLRRSSGKQEASLEQQMEINAAYIEKKGYLRAPGQEQFTETMSGKTFDRPEFQRLINLVTEQQNKFNIVVMYKPNRMGRAKQIEEFFYYEFILSKQGVRIEYALNDECNLEGIAGFMMRGLNYQAAAQYIIDLSNDTTRGLLWNAERGFHFGGEPCYGYDRMLVDMQGNNLGILQLGMHKSDRKDLKVIYVKRNDGLPEFLYEHVWQLSIEKGWGCAQTAYHLNELLEKGGEWKPQKSGRTMTRRDGSVLKYSGFWSPSTIKEMWQRTTYIGWRTVKITTDNEFHNEERICKNAHEPIVEDKNIFWELFDRDSKKIWNVPKSQYRKEGVKYPLTRKGICKQCNEYWMGALTSHGRGKVRYYRDRGSFKKCCPVKDWSLPAQKFEDVVFDIILKEIQNKSYNKRIAEYVAAHSPIEKKEQYEAQKETIIFELGEVQKSLQNLLELAKERPNSKHLIAELDSLEAKEHILGQRIHEVEVQIQRCEPVDYSELEKMCKMVLENNQEIRTDDLEKRREVFLTFVKEFYVDKIQKEITITFYGIPLLSIIRNEFLDEQERSLKYGNSTNHREIPEFCVTLAYRTRRFIVPEEYRFAVAESNLEELVEEEDNSEEKQEEVISPETKAMKNAKQLKLF